MSQKQNVLLVEDDLPIARVYQEYLKKEPYALTHVDCGKDALDFIDQNTPDVVILDLKLPDMDGIEILKHIQQRAIATAVIVITAHGSVNSAVEAMREGAADFMMKPFNADRLIFTLRHALERQQLTQIVRTLSVDNTRTQYCKFIGSSAAMQSIYRTIDNAAPSSATVFITGESGTGKELCAEAIHQQSPRSSKPFVTLNCGAIPENLMESEIFGHVKGAFTGAIANRDGLAKQANGGTLFLDEICEMSLTLQVKLLRFIQTKTFQKVGGSELEKVDVRFVCATNKNPWGEVSAGNFREDLYYRLHVIPIHLPPLRDRGDDVMKICEQFLEAFSKEEGKKFTTFSDDARETITNYEWPGNVRQLQNAIRNAVVLHDGEELTAAMLPPLAGGVDIAAAAVSTSPVSPAAAATSNIVLRPMWQVEREMIEAAMAECGDNVHRAAALLEISPSTIYRRIRDEENGEDQL
ncbi:MAG: sigma-54-dependent Fis family transcriptional regulator [Hyphomicrobiales bacterium]|nr:MAG: sigma-54-dependent Fis family transcriptional regulator [Hyphomicrobiales bacterium]